MVADGEPETILPKAGRRPTENFDVDEYRDARDAGRNGDGITGCCGIGDGGGCDVVGGEIVGVGLRASD